MGGPRLLPSGRAGRRTQDKAANCSVHPCYEGRIRRPASSSISLTHEIMRLLIWVNRHTVGITEQTGSFSTKSKNFARSAEHPNIK
jgi:hypothetical protein